MVIRQSYDITGDSHYEVSATLPSGKTITASDGYVTNGMDAQHDILIDGLTIKITDAPAR